MQDLRSMKCEPCRGGVPPLTGDTIETYLRQTPSWTLGDHEGVLCIRREFTFPDFRQAMGFAVEVGMLAEEQGHHPDLRVAWGRVVVETWTHKILGLHANDFILAARIDELHAARKG